MEQMAISLSAGYTFLCLNLLAVLNFHCLAEDIFIRPSENTMCQFWPCLTLNEFARNPKQHISESENTTFIIFSSGNHHLHRHLNLNKVSNLVLTSFLNGTHDHATALIIVKLVPMMFIYCNNITIADLVFNIGNGYSTTLEKFPVIIFQGTTGFLSQLSVSGYVPIISHAAIEIYLSRFEISDVMILNVISYYHIGGGGALSAFNSTLSFHGVNIFANNSYCY